MQDSSRAFVDLLLRFEALRFGDFTLKSGRKSPYFMNAGQLRSGDAMRGLGQAYADTIVREQMHCDLIFGPAYKGVPLAVATAMGMVERTGQDMPFCFDRKEAKDHGEGGIFVGAKPEDGQRVVIVDDVITSGISIRQSVQQLREHAKVEIAGVVVAVDRMEKGQGEKSTLQELQDDLGLKVASIVSIREIVTLLSGEASSEGSRFRLSAAQKQGIEDYLAQYGA